MKEIKNSSNFKSYNRFKRHYNTEVTRESIEDICSKDVPVIVLSFQSKDVLEKLKNNRYQPCSEFSRESRDYSEDVKQCGGFPTWCFSPLVLDKGATTFLAGDFKDKMLFERYRCEMRLPMENDFSQFHLYVIEVQSSRLHIGITHNAYYGSMVFSGFSIKDVKSVYDLSAGVEDDWGFAMPAMRLIFGESQDFFKEFEE